MKITEENVFRLLGSVPDRGMTVKELLIALNQKKKRKTFVRKMLKRLAQLSQCYKQNNRYFLSESAIEKGSTGRKPNQKTKAKRKTAPGSKCGVGGIILLEKGKQCVYSFSSLKKIALSNRNARDLLPGDTVKFSLHNNASFASFPFHNVSKLIYVISVIVY